MPLFNNVLAGAAGSGGAAAFKIERSIRLNSGDQSKLTRTPSTQSNTKTWTLSWWMKAPKVDSTIFSAGAGNNPGRFGFGTNGNGAFFAFVIAGGSTVFSITTDAFFRDPSAWYHCCLVCDSTAGVQADRFKIIVNGVRQTVTGTLMPLNQNTYVNTTANHQWSGRSYTAADFADGYLADVHFIDGQALAATDFGGYDDNVWQPKEFTGSHNFTPTVTYPAVYITSPGAYGAVTDVNTVNGSVFSSAGSTGSGSIKVEFASAITGVTHVKFKGGAYSLNAGFSIKVNGSTTHTGLSTNSSYAVRTEALSSATDITSFEIVSTSDGWALGDLQFSTDGTNFTAPSGTAAVIPTAGANGFHLNFSDASSNAALGFDANVSGTRYSSFTTGFQSNYSPANMFDGSTSTFTLGSNGGGIMTFTPGTAISYAAASGGVEVYFHQTSQPDRVRINGGSWVNQTNGSTGGWQTVSTGDGSITKMEFQDQATSEAIIYAIRVNGTILTDPSGANDWTVNNFVASGFGNTPGVTTTVPQDVTGDWLGILGITPTNTNGTFATIPDGGGSTQPDKGKFYWSGLTIGDTITLYGTGSGQNRTVTGDVSEASSPGYVAVPGSSFGNFNVTVTAASGSCKVDHNGAFTCYGITPGPLASRYFDDGIDTPTNYESAFGNNGGNYATWNPLFGENKSLSNGNLNAQAAAAGYAIIASTVAMTSGKWYMEYHYTSNINSNGDGGNFITFGISQTNRDGAEGSGVTATAEDFGFKCWSSGFRSQTSNVNQHNYSSSVSTGDILSLAFDADAGKLWVAKNGTWMTNASGTGDPANGNNPDFSSLAYSGGYLFMAGPYNGNSISSELEANFGARPFSYSPPTGFLGLCTTNLPDPTIADGSTAFDAITYVGTDATRTFTGFNMSPDLVWFKSRSTAYDHILFDSVRGATKRLKSNSTAAEDTNSTGLTAFTSDGFTVGGADSVNGPSNHTYVAWAWDAGTSNTTISAGSLNSSLYNQSATWTGDLTTNGGTSWFGGAAANAFDGSTSTFVQGAVGGDVTFSPTTGIAVSSSMRIWADSGSGFGVGNGPYTITYNGTQVYSGSMWSSPYTITAAAGTTFSSLVIAPSGGEAMRLFAVEIDGRLLINSGVSVANVPAVASTVRANPSAGFSIVKVDNPTATESRAHGLNKKPDLIIGKALTGSQQWHIYHSALGKDYYGTFQTNAFASSDQWGSQEPDSNLFYVKTNTGSGANYAGGMIYYLWTAVESYSAFGSYVGNGSADGPFVHLNGGFRPRWILIKTANKTDNWRLWDSARSTYNAANTLLFADLSIAEISNAAYDLDFLSNGFKLRTSNSDFNGSGDTMIYIAFAENPFQANGGLAR